MSNIPARFAIYVACPSENSLTATWAYRTGLGLLDIRAVSQEPGERRRELTSVALASHAPINQVRYRSLFIHVLSAYPVTY